jgi:hypothetical protein
VRAADSPEMQRALAGQFYPTSRLTLAMMDRKFLEGEM